MNEMKYPFNECLFFVFHSAWYSKFMTKRLLKIMKRKGYLPTFEKCEGRVENMLKLGPIIL